MSTTYASRRVYPAGTYASRRIYPAHDEPGASLATRCSQSALRRYNDFKYSSTAPFSFSSSASGNVCPALLLPGRVVSK